MSIALDSQIPAAAGDRRPAESEIWRVVKKVLMPLSSLKLTVILLALAAFIVLAGTFAQTQYDIWIVVRDYFRTSFVWIELKVFFPKSFFPDIKPEDVTGAIPFPGGWLIGALMAINLVSAHLVRFTIRASGKQLWTGLGVLAVGVLVTTMVVLGGSGSGLQAEPAVSWQLTWTVCKLILAAAGVGLVGYSVMEKRLSSLMRKSCLVGGCVIEAAALALFIAGDAVALGDSSMRILWQLIQGGMAGIVLLVGCCLIFGKRGGVVLLHAGVGLLMFSELLVGISAEESQMHVKEGELVNFVQDIREVELAIVDPSDPQRDSVVTIPQSRFVEAFESSQHPLFPKTFVRKMPESLRNLLRCKTGEQFVELPGLPFDARIVRFFQNSRQIPVDKDNLATKGVGLTTQFAESQAANGVKDSSVDESAAYVEFIEKGTDKSLGVYACSLLLSRYRDFRVRTGWDEAESKANIPPFLYQLSLPQSVEANGKSYDISLRFKRIYKPYSVELSDVRSDTYIGTSTVKNYSSDVVLTSGDVAVPRHIWMNNPLRFGGETFYQSSYYTDPFTGQETTGLQVVTNTGWMIPYVSCMIVGVGMLFQFGVTLSRALGRAATPRVIKAGADVIMPAKRDSFLPSSGLEFYLSAAAVGLCFLLANYSNLTRTPVYQGFDFDLAGQIPVVYEGRVKPLDTLARNTLLVMSNRDSVPENPDAPSGKGKTLQAIRWLFDLMSGATDDDRTLDPRVEDYPVFRIDNLDVIKLFDLTHRKGNLYSLNQLRPKAEEFHNRVQELRSNDKSKKLEQLDISEKKLLDLDRRIRTFTAIEARMSLKQIEALSMEPDPQVVRTLKERAVEIRQELAREEQRIMEQHPPLVVPVPVPGDPEKLEWKPLVVAATNDHVLGKILGEQQESKGVALWKRILTAYKKNEPGEFNRSVRDYLELVKQSPPPLYSPGRTNFEAAYNNAAPLHGAWTLYILAFVGTAIGWLLAMANWGRPVQKVVWVAIITTFVVHTISLIGRMYISGRPPVTNLYSSAVFIGWGAVLAGIILESVFRFGFGNAIASIAGILTLLISFKLSNDGDTFTVMQAVLDTQFWLATHVVCISLGYSATFVAGLLGMMYVVHGFFTPYCNARIRETLTSMIYGSLCFAILLSFIGTVLGGLWADDSWGRFWGWDPKENGALIIVLWNALVLHARWGAMVKERGLAVLALGGNIVTSWSWFGVNELGVGLHSYGFTEGTLWYLSLFMGVNLLLIFIGSLPKFLWSSLIHERTGSNQHQPPPKTLIAG